MKSQRFTLTPLLIGLLALACASAAHAQKAGDNVVTAGWLGIQTHSTSDPLTTELLDVPINYPLSLPSSFTSPGSGISTSDANTLGLTLSHFFTDQIALTAIAGIPPVFKLYGQGELVPPGPAGVLGRQSLGDPALNPIVTQARQWSLAGMAQYHFFQPGTKFRPFVGLGLSYNFFTDIEVNPAFADSIRSNLGATLAAAAGIPGPTTVKADASASWAPVFNLGATYNFTERWGLTGSLTYIPMSTTSSMEIRAADGTLLSTSKTKLKPEPILFFVGVSYKF